jgi:hypothetical protein
MRQLACPFHAERGCALFSIWRVNIVLYVGSLDSSAICQFEPEEMHQGSSHDLHLPVCKFLPQADAGGRLLSWKKEDWLDVNGRSGSTRCRHCLQILPLIAGGKRLVEQQMD